MGYLFATASSQYMDTTVTAATYPFTMACWLWCASNSVQNFIAMSLVDKTAAKLQFSFNPAADGNVYLIAQGNTTFDVTHKAAYAATTWTPVIAVVHSASNRDLYVGANTDNSTTNIGTITGMTNVMVGARWDNVPSGPEAFFEGKVAEPVLAIGEEWDTATRAAYIAGTETHKITGVTPDLYKNLIEDASSPDGNSSYGTAFTLVNTPTVTDHPSVLTGQNKKKLSITGTNQQVIDAFASLMYTPDSAYEGSDTMVSFVLDDEGLSDTASTTITVSPDIGSGPPNIRYIRRRRNRDKEFIPWRGIWV